MGDRIFSYVRREKKFSTAMVTMMYHSPLWRNRNRKPSKQPDRTQAPLGALDKSSGILIKIRSSAKLNKKDKRSAAITAPRPPKAKTEEASTGETTETRLAENESMPLIRAILSLGTRIPTATD